MESQPQQSGNRPPPKPRERASSSTGPAPFKPPSSGSTSDVVEASGTAQHGGIVSTAGRNMTVNTSALGRAVPARPWEQQTYGSTYGDYGSGLNYNSGYGSGLNYNSGYGSGLNYNSGYGSGTLGSYGGFGGSYGGGLYGNNMYRGGYGGLYGGSGMYNGGLGGTIGGLGGAIGSFGGTMGGYGIGMGGSYGDQDPNNPSGAPSSPPGFWMSFLHVMQGVVTFLGRIAILIDQNTQALHMFLSALLQLFDRSGLLYGELARFVLRLLGIRTKPKRVHPPLGPDRLPGPQVPHGNPNNIVAWEGVWGENAGN